MPTFLYSLAEMPLAYRRTFALFGTGLLLLCTPACEKSSQPAASNSPANGQVIPFTADSERYRVSGWTKSEGDYAWSEGTSAKLALPIPAGAGPLSVMMKLRGLVKPPDLPFQPVAVYVNGQKIADWEVADSASFTAQVPADVSNEKTLNLEFRIPKAASPKALGINADDRILGICAYSIEIKQG
jgi:hypothetical protein